MKPKCHILTHIVGDVRRFGPPVLMSTETFESFNGVFRNCSVLSNHHAPSRDIAMKIADMDRFKHIASGGRWLENGEWVRAGKDVLQFMRTHDTLQNYLGWSKAKPKQGMTSFNDYISRHSLLKQNIKSDLSESRVLPSKYK